MRNVFFYIVSKQTNVMCSSSSGSLSVSLFSPFLSIIYLYVFSYKEYLVYVIKKN